MNPQQTVQNPRTYTVSAEYPRDPTIFNHPDAPKAYFSGDRVYGAARLEQARETTASLTDETLVWAAGGLSAEGGEDGIPFILIVAEPQDAPQVP